MNIYRKIPKGEVKTFSEAWEYANYEMDKSGGSKKVLKELAEKTKTISYY